MTNTASEHFQPSLKELSELKNLTREYGRFSKNAVGLGHVLGGGLVFLSAYVLQHHVDLGVWPRLFLGAAPFAWILGKEWLREHYYQFSGRVTQPRSLWEMVVLSILTGALALINLAAVGFVVYRLVHGFSWWLAPSSMVYVALLLAMPFVVWRYLRAPYEFVVGVFLLTLSAYLLSGSPLARSPGVGVVHGLALAAELVALVMILVGIVEHFEFVKLRRKMRALKEAS